MGRYLGSIGARIVSTSLITLTWFLSLFIFYEVGYASTVTYLPLFNWIDSGYFIVNFALIFDSITATMLIVVTTVSALVHLYSTGYMSHDPHIQRFMSYLSLFTFFMLILVTSDNYLQLFIGWEGVGLCSYLLINFWFTRLQANKSAIQAMVVNRIGDLGIAMAMFILIARFGTLDFSTIFAISHLMVNDTITLFSFEINTITAISLFLLLGAVGKSAQVGLHTWLPMAMEGPTPVSALIHAATMVTAGVFLLIRSSPIIEYSNFALNTITIIGAITALLAATIGLVQNDIKKVIAYSTCSQLGYMVFACGVSNYSVSLFHLMNHAFFKALLFLSAGSIIHALADEQDMRKMGGLIKSLPYTYSLMLIGSLSLMGFPFLTGFYSKDAILEFTFAQYNVSATFAYWLGAFSALCTSYYSIRLIILSFISSPKSSQINILNAHESPWNMSLPLLILSFGSIFVGYLLKDMFIGAGTNFFGASIFVMPEHLSIINAEFLPPFIKLIPVIFSLFGAFLAIYLYTFMPNFLVNLKLSNIGREFYIFLSNRWHWDFVYNFYIVKSIFIWGHDVSYKIIDKGILEYIGPTGITIIIKKASSHMSKLQSGQVYNYALCVLVFTTLYIYYATMGNINVEFLIIIPLFLILF